MHNFTVLNKREYGKEELLVRIFVPVVVAGMVFVGCPHVSKMMVILKGLC